MEAVAVSEDWSYELKLVVLKSSPNRGFRSPVEIVPEVTVRLIFKKVKVVVHQRNRITLRVGRYRPCPPEAANKIVPRFWQT